MKALPTADGPRRFRQEFRSYCYRAWHRNLPARFKLPLWLVYENPLEHLLVPEDNLP